MKIGFDTTETRHAFEVDAETRVIRGLAVPYGVPSLATGGAKYQFERGSIKIPDDVGRVKPLVGHDSNRAVGKATKLEETDAGLLAEFKVARGAAGDEALQMAEDGVWDGLSVGLRGDGQFSRDRKSGVQLGREHSCARSP